MHRQCLAKSAGLWLTFVVSLGLSSFVNANDYLTITGKVSGQSVYEIVFKSDKNTTEQKPGIYAIQTSGDLTPVVTGEVLGVSKGFNGILAQSSNDMNMESAESFAVIDGRLTLFNRNVKKGDRKNRPLVLGTDSLPIFEPQLGMNLNIPIDIQSLSDISVRSMAKLESSESLPNGGELFLVSIRQENYLGRGITVAIVVENGTSKTNGPGSFRNHATVLNYDFLDNQSLSVLDLTFSFQYQNPEIKRTHLLSSASVSSLLMKLKTWETDPLIKEWISYITKNSRQLLPNKNGELKQSLSVKMMAGIPTLDLLAEQTDFTALPARSLVDDLNLYQVYDPRNNTWYVVESSSPSDYPISPLGTKGANAKKIRFFPSSKFDKEKNKIEGKVEIDSKGQYKVTAFKNTESSFTQSEMIISVGGSTMVLLKNREGLLKPAGIGTLNISDRAKVEVAHIKGSPVENDGLIHYLLISSKKTRNANGVIDAITILEQGDEFKAINQQTIGDIFISAEELELRSRLLLDDAKFKGLYVDVSGPVRGPAAYRKIGEGSETVTRQPPYKFLPLNPHAMSYPSSFYLKASKRANVTFGGAITWLQFGSKSREEANKDYTGFYIDLFRNGQSMEKDLTLALPLSKTRSQMIEGVPLFSGGDKSTPLVLDHIKLEADGEQTLGKLSIVPYEPLQRSKKTGFSLLMTLTDEFSTQNSSSQMHSVVDIQDVPADFDSLVGAQILQGKRRAKSDFHILLFFGKDKNSLHKGIYVISGQAFLDTNSGSAEYVLRAYHSKWLTDQITPPNELKRRIRPDSRGNLYWLDNPQEPQHSMSLRARKLYDPSRLIYVNKERDGQEPIAIRFHEKFEAQSGRGALFSRWNLTGRIDTTDKISTFKEYVNSLKKKADKASKEGKGRRQKDDWLNFHEESAPQFRSFLESLATDEAVANKKRQIVLVEESRKATFINDLFVMLTQLGKNFNVAFDSSTGNIEFYNYDVTATVEESQRETDIIRKTGMAKPTLLYTTLKDMASAPTLLRDEEKVETPAEDGDEKEKKEDTPILAESSKNANLSRWLMLATDGEKVDLSKVKHLGETDVDIPTLIIGTPGELRDILASQSDAVEAGVFDQFEINSDFLTSSWHEWAPNNKLASKEAKESAKLPVTEEEYRVFPDLEKLFAAAAEGELRGQKVVLKVSKEIKPLIHRLIMTRWTNSSGKPSPWNFRNENLLFYQLKGNRVENNQSLVVENFQAMRGGARSHNVVFVADLERINQIGRPYLQDGKPFKLKDTISQKQTSAFDMDGDNESDELSPEDERRLAGLIEEKEEHEKAIVEMNAELAKLDKNARPDRVRQLTELIKQQKAELENTVAAIEANAGVRVSSREALPHLMWWIAAEGQEVQPKVEKNWSLSKAVDHQVASIIIATPDEWERLESDLAFESKFFDINEEMTVLELNSPDEDVKYNLVRSLFEKPEIKSLSLDFYISQLSSDDAARQLIYHFVNRVEQIAIQQKIEPTTAFIRAFAELRRVLTEDSSLRRTRMIDKQFLERLFFKIFPLPISLENLETNDPLLQMQEVQEFSRAMQRNGYHGPMSLKERTIDTALSQTRGSDAGRPIPNSQILFGDTGSGKTFLFKTMVRTLDLKAYDPHKANNEEANYIIIPVQNLVEEDNNETGKLTVDEAIAQVEDLIAQPNGHRAFILWDDAHKTASAKIHQKLFSHIQSFFEAPGGVIRVKKRGTKEIKEVPVQNLNLYMTVNPTANLEQRKKYAEGSNVVKLVLAALATHNIDLEESVIARWSDIINLDKFPRGAKVPALVERVRQASVNTSATVLVSSKAIDTLVSRFPNAHAREFLNPAATALTRIPPAAQVSNLYIVTPKTELPNQTESKELSSFLGSSDLNRSVQEMTQIDPVNIDEPGSILKLIEFLTSNFRTQVYNHFLLGTQNTDILKYTVPGQTTVIQNNLIVAVMSHLTKNPELPISEVRVLGQDFSFLGDIRLQELVEIQTTNKRKSQYFPFPMGADRGFSIFDTRGFTSDSALVESQSRTRQDVFFEYVNKIEGILKEMLINYTRLKSGDLNQVLTWDDADIQRWFEEIPKEDRDEQFKELTKQLLETYNEFMGDFFDPKLSDRNTDINFTLYDHGRIFSYLVDKAITRLPWGLMSKFVLDVMEQSTDLSLGQKPNFIQYAFHHDISPLAVVPNDFFNEVFADRISDQNKMDQLDRSLKNKCDAALTKKGDN